MVSSVVTLTTLVDPDQFTGASPVGSWSVYDVGGDCTWPLVATHWSLIPEKCCWRSPPEPRRVCFMRVGYAA